VPLYLPAREATYCLNHGWVNVHPMNDLGVGTERRLPVPSAVVETGGTWPELAYLDAWYKHDPTLWLDVVMTDRLVVCEAVMHPSIPRSCWRWPPTHVSERWIVYSTMSMAPISRCGLRSFARTCAQLDGDCYLAASLTVRFPAFHCYEVVTSASRLRLECSRRIEVECQL